jgi:hypothetical protein
MGSNDPHRSDEHRADENHGEKLVSLGSAHPNPTATLGTGSSHRRHLNGL